MATYQLSNLISEVQRKAKDSTFSSALITDYLNDVQDEVLGSKVLSFQETSFDTTLPSGSHTVDFLNDMQSALGLVLVDANSNASQPAYVPFRQFFESNPSPATATAGLPSCYTVFESQLVFDRPADQTYDMTLRYLKQPTRLENSTDVPSIPEAFKEVLVRGALANVEEYRENFDIAAVHRRRCEDLVEAMNVRLSGRQLLRTAKATTSRAVSREI